MFVTLFRANEQGLGLGTGFALISSELHVTSPVTSPGYRGLVRSITMNRFDGTSARQLDLVDDLNGPITARPEPRGTRQPALRLLQKDVYAELARRRRRAQIATRHFLEDQQ